MPVQNNLYICFGVNLDPQYEYTICPHTENAAHTYIQPYTESFYEYVKSRANKHTESVSYIREDSNTVKVNIPKDHLEGANYLIFDNEPLSNSTFPESKKDVKHYAFIDKLEYINDNCTRIRFSIDVLSTWLPYISIEKATVIREHADYDGIGDNIQEEPFEISNYFPVQVPGVTNLAASEEYYAVIAITASQGSFLASTYITGDALKFDYSNDYKFRVMLSGSDTQSTQYIETQFPISYNGAVSGMSYWVIRMNPQTFTHPYKDSSGKYTNDLYWLFSLISTLRNDLNSEIYGAWLIPVSFMNGRILQYYGLLGGNKIDLREAQISESQKPKYGFLKNINSAADISKVLSVGVNSLQFDSPHKRTYTAVNKKMLNYPFKRFVVSTPNNDTVIPPEILFQSPESSYGQINCIMALVFSPEPELVISIPNSRYYQGKSVASLRPFLKLNFSLNTQQARDIEKELGYMKQALAGSLEGAKAGNTILGKMGLGLAYGAAYETMQRAEYAAQERIPPANNGVISDQALFVARQITSNAISFFSMYMDYMDAENAEKVDKFFTAYGYATNQIKQPNLFIQDSQTTGDSWKKHCRRIFNYLQANDCVIVVSRGEYLPYNSAAFDQAIGDPTGIMPPAEDLAKIKQILAKGITVWMDPSYVGDYAAKDTTLTQPKDNRFRYDLTSVDTPVKLT